MAGDLDYILRVRVRDVKDYDNFALVCCEVMRVVLKARGQQIV